MNRFAQLRDALAEKEHVLTVASYGGDRVLADRTRLDARAIRGELRRRRSWRPWLGTED
jgi:hypothetical protein